ncbi:aromatic ring-opening dioxygenase subunit LigA [Caulobacter sp. RHG1]|uniref:aromatic ring-opening dioxygenase subunit LigA n=1 Tax=Caulobacter sp. (strain RHG1) TaxID=2545762 RepID=UPI00155288C2|nr:aromatic ring-opening dioxygenase subunit LigA [Caulobacter sp. RHG1]NQE60764.1 hypothetical protein [Caulobacter sp. RHG1]
MSLYALQKLLFTLNRDPALQAAFKADPAPVLDGYRLTDEERGAMTAHDVGLLYVLGVNGQILMHFAAFCGFAWPDYLEAMREGVRRHGPVRAGVYALTSSLDEKVAGL